MSGKTLKTEVVIGGKLEASINKTMEAFADKMDTLKAAAEKATTAYDKMSDTLTDQSKALKDAKKRYAAYVLEGKEGTEQAEALAKEIKEMSASLKKNQAAMKAAEKAAEAFTEEVEESTDSVDDLSDAAKDTKEGFTIMKGAIAGVIANGITSLIEKCADAAQSIYGLAESTREYREDMGKLETAYEAAGRSTELATETYKNFYSVLGEEDRSVEAVNHLAKFVETERDMQKWTNIAAGVWGTFGDSLPIEGLTEAANETAKVGEVTGVLADALNWAGVRQEDFQTYLDKCSNEQERAAYITAMLNDLYADAADKYRENNASIIDARLANSDYTDSLAAIGERIEPVTTAVTQGFNSLLEKTLELTDSIDMERVIDGVEKSFNALGKAIEWVSENGDILLPILGGLTAALVTYKAATIAVTAAEAIKTAVLATGATTVTAATVATWALNAAMAVLTSPITLVVAAIGLLVAGGIALYRNWDTVKAKAMELGAKLSQIWSSISNAVGNMIAKIGEHFPIFGGYLSGWWESIKAAVENVKGIFRGVIDFISNIFAGNWKEAWGNVIDIFGNLFGMMGNIAKAPLNGVIGMINSVIDKINNISIDIPEWMGGGTFGVNIPKIPMLATGGFTDGISIAGEKAVEAVISFDPAYRSENLAYWAEAGRMLGADMSDFSLGSGTSSTSYNMGDVTFAPNITINGNADKQTVMEAIEEEYPEFIDMLEEWFAGRGVPVYG